MTMSLSSIGWGPGAAQYTCRQAHIITCQDARAPENTNAYKLKNKHTCHCIITCRYTRAQDNTSLLGYHRVPQKILPLVKISRCKYYCWLWEIHHSFSWQMQEIHFVIHTSSGLVIYPRIAKWYQDNIKLEKQQDNLGHIHHMYPHVYFTSEKGLVFCLYLPKFNMDFSLFTVIFATVNFR